MKTRRRLSLFFAFGAAALGVVALVVGDYLSAVVMVFVIAGQLLVLRRIRRGSDI
jgi:hypothetical protein